MTALVPTGFNKPEPVDMPQTCLTNLSKQAALNANAAFDEAVKHYLHHCIDQGTLFWIDRGFDDQNDTDTFLQQGALRSFFAHHEDALERLLQEEPIARHLLRPDTRVFFQPDGYEPLLSTFEKRIYNLAAHHEYGQVPFRYSPKSRQDGYGNSIDLADSAAREDIGCYFGTRRSDETALNLIARQLHREALFSNALTVHVVTEGYMEDSLRIIRKTTEQLHQEGVKSVHCFVVQRRHAADDRHLGAALLLMDTEHPQLPQRIIFCDTLKPNALPPWWSKFKRYVDTVFPQPVGEPPASDRLEDGSVNLQRLHDGVPIRHQDIDCAFYSASMARALIQLSKQSPDLIINGSIIELIAEMTQRMPEYFLGANMARKPEWVREVNVVNRWQAGRDALMDIQQRSQMMFTTLPSLDKGDLDWEEHTVASAEMSSAA
ncbi:hypothetical protein [Spirosoma gilvum]